MTLESLIRSDVISSKKTLLAYTFPNNGVHDQLRNTGVIQNWTLAGACFKAFICFIQERLSMFLNLVGVPGGSWGSRIRDVSKGWSPGSSSLPLSAVLSALHILPSPGSIHKFRVTVLVVPWLRLESNGMLSSD